MRVISSRICPLTERLFTQGYLIVDENGILYNFDIMDEYFQIYHFLTKFTVAVIPFKDKFFMWDALTDYFKEAQ